LQALALSLPAATTATTPALTPLLMAASVVAGSIALYASTIATQPVRAPTVKTAITNFATRNVITNPGAGSPNLVINANWN